ncbi:hypothetical protein LCGC14_0699990 [marine sediment metagenome]|uniref:Glycosyl transferase family 1 domain-containing protein n=1 Tax=marine sediment metagenome TaxID=412755 RepID=A0A0F9T422_9ZZZZ
MCVFCEQFYTFYPTVDIITKKKYDVYYAVDVSAANTVSLLGKKARQRLFLRVGASLTLDLISQNKIVEGSLYQKFFLYQEQHAYRKAAKIIPNGYWSYNYMKTFVSEEKISELIYSPVNVQCFNRNVLLREKTRNFLGFNDDNFIILFPGRLDYRKGGHIFIEILEKLALRNINFKALIIGTGVEKSRIEQLIKKKVLGTRIYMLGIIPHKEMPRFYSAADCFVLPALPAGQAEDAMPNSVLEAMAYRLPIIVSSLGGLPHFIDHGRDGYLIPPGDVTGFSNQIEELAHGREKCLKIGEEARSKIIKYCSPEIVTEKLIRTFEEN